MTSPVMDGSKTVTQMGAELLEELRLVANGKKTKAEVYGFNDIAISRLCNYV